MIDSGPGKHMRNKKNKKQKIEKDFTKLQQYL